MGCNYAREREGYEGSWLNCFHILIEEKGEEWVTNSSSYAYKCEIEKVHNRLNKPVKEKVVKVKEVKEPNPIRKEVIDMSTGVFYHSITEAAFAHNMKMSLLANRLSGLNTNKTQLRYI